MLYYLFDFCDQEFLSLESGNSALKLCNLFLQSIILFL